MPKTNNSVEGWHTGFESTLAQVHSHIFKFIEAIHREQEWVEANTEQVVAGNPLAKKKNVYKDSAARLQELVKRYPGNIDEDNISDNDADDDDNRGDSNCFITYLRGIAHNITLYVWYD